MPQLCGARNHVFLLHGGSDGSEISEIHMVEEVHDLDTIGKSVEVKSKRCRSVSHYSHSDKHNGRHGISF